MNNNQTNTKTCPVEIAGSLDNRFRRFLHNPAKILSPHISPGMTVLDLGCGPGVFTIEIANLLSSDGKVIAADLQQGMLNIVNKKISGTRLAERVSLHKCAHDSIALTEKVDFVLAFYMIHEVADQEKLLTELKACLKHGGKIYIIEPKFHVTKKAFAAMLVKSEHIGFLVNESPKVFFSRTAILTSAS